MNLTVVLGFFLFLLATCDQLLIKDFLSGRFLISKLKQYPFRDFISCIKKEKNTDDNYQSLHFESF